MDGDGTVPDAKKRKSENAKTKSQRTKKGIRGRRKAFKHFLEEMYAIDGANCEAYEVGMKPYAIYFQTEEMERNFEAYPEVLLIDSSYEVSALGMRLHVFMNADGNGQCTVVGFCFAMEDDETVISFLTKTFVQFNPETYRTKSIMLDYPLYRNHLKIVMSQFPNATSFLCCRFAVRAYRTKVATGNGVKFQNDIERDMCSELFQRMALAKNEQTYSQCFERFKLYIPPLIHNYFVINWHRKKNQWVDYLKDSNSSFLDQRHCEIQAIEGAVNIVCKNYTSPESFVHHLISVMASLKLQRKRKALGTPVKGPVVTSPYRMAEIQYKNFLTPYAFSLVKKQMETVVSVKIVDNGDADQCTIVSPKYGEITCTPVSCLCMVFTVIGLPCCHVFAVRNDKGLNAFEKSLCRFRWTLQHLRKSLSLEIRDVGLVPDAASFGTCAINECEAAAKKSTKVTVNRPGVSEDEELKDAPPKPSTPNSKADTKDKKNASLDDPLEEVVIDEVDPDGDISLLEEMEDSGSVSNAGTIDWADMLGAL